MQTADYASNHFFAVPNTIKSSSERLRSNSYEMSAAKRTRAGSISGRLRAASDLEESGYIDKHQKGLIKDLIISGDQTLQLLLDKYEQGDRKELLDLIGAGYLGKQTVDILDGLDFDFLNNFPIDSTDEADLQQQPHSNNGHHHLQPLHPAQYNNNSHPAQHNNFPAHTNNNGHHHGQHGNHGSGAADGRYRRESIDVLLQDLLHEDFPLPAHAHNTTNHSGMSSSDFGEIFQSFSDEPLAALPQASTGTRRKSIRLEDNSGSSGASTIAGGGGGVDLSAYATMAAALQSSAGNADNATSSRYASSSSSSHHHHVHVPYSKPAYYTASGQEIILPADAKELGYIGAYSPEQRRERINKFLDKRTKRVWTKKVKYDVRKNFADSRMRIKGRFVKKEDEDIMRELLTI